ncbi:hypothetical protein IQ229_05720 [Nostoc cf. edaphicum LEGE 07299]|uniref:Uncharacterized protein n=1 Tax=Nostoc cf. edaphicum LEGE 07299 TaxID=2777974 RepID=A0ABR9TWI8_9NOSO|nr:hypothetical protein [Nostoc edaphicum]MBE9104450.1 hypothetical protein [Nostoc cf. edaphicum LEGE 07299]
MRIRDAIAIYLTPSDRLALLLLHRLYPEIATEVMSKETLSLPLESNLRKIKPQLEYHSDN